MKILYAVCTIVCICFFGNAQEIQQIEVHPQIFEVLSSKNSGTVSQSLHLENRTKLSSANQMSHNVTTLLSQENNSGTRTTNAAGCDLLSDQWDTPAPTPSTFTFGPNDYVTGVPCPTLNTNPTDVLGLYERYTSANPGVDQIAGIQIGLGFLIDPNDDMTFRIALYDDDGFGAPGVQVGATGVFSPTALGVPTTGFFQVYDLSFPTPLIPSTPQYHVGVEIFAGDANDTLVVISSASTQGQAAGLNHVQTSGFGLVNYLSFIGIDFDLHIIPFLADIENPVINCPGAIVGDTTLNPVTYTTPTATDDCTVNVTQTAGLPSGSTFPLGITTNTFVATDSSGNTDTCSFTVNLAFDCASISGNIVYVDSNATGANNGADWANALTDLQDAIIAVNDCPALDTIYVAEGTYYPTATTDRTISFEIPGNTNVYGGFSPSNGAIDLATRNFNAYPTILSGDIGVAATSADNSYHVVSMVSAGTTILLDGFNVVDGNANGGGTNDLGGGIYGTNAQQQITIINCTISNNAATESGGGFYVLDAVKVDLVNSILNFNSSGNLGGGFSNVNPELRVENVLFHDNTAVTGGGLNYQTSSSVFDLEIIGSTFTQNNASANGSALYLNNTGDVFIYFINNIFWNNGPLSIDVLNFANVTQVGSNSLYESFSLIGDCCLIDVDPLFTNPAAYDFTLQPNSPVLDIGTNGDVTQATDLNGNTRILDGDGNGTATVDYGAFEAGAMAASNIEVTASGDLEFIDNDDRDDNLTIVLDGANYRFTDPDNTLTAGLGAIQIDPNTVDVLITSVTGAINVDTAGGDDTLTTDYSGGNFQDLINYNGGTQNSTNPGDILRLQGGSTFTSVEHVFTNENDGNVVVTGNPGITYTGLEPIIDNLDVTDRIFTFTGTDETITLSDDIDVADNESFIDSTLGENITFTNPTNSLTINTEASGGSGADIVNIQGLDTNFDADLTLNGGADDDANFQTNPTSIGIGSYDINARTITASQNVTTNLTGIINFSASQNIIVNSTAFITAADGNITFNANAAGTLTGVNATAILITDAATVSTSGSGTINLMGVGVSDGVGNGYNGIQIINGALIENTGNGAISLTGTGGDGVTNNTGIYISGASNITGIDGMISLTGISGNGTGSFNEGITMLTGSLISATGNGSITMSGTGSGGVDSNKGIVLFGTDAEVRTNGGGISITGVSSGTGNNNFGISLETGTLINDLGNGLVSLSGTGGDGVDTNFGINLNNTTVRATNNDVIINGTAGNGSGNSNIGASISNGTLIENTGTTGSLDIIGSGGDGVQSNTGIAINSSILRSANGDVSTNGTAGNGSGNSNKGVLIINGSLIEKTGAVGSLSISGIGGNGIAGNTGIEFNNSIVRCTNGDIVTNGIGGNGSGNINIGVLITNGAFIDNTATSGNLSLTGTGGDGVSNNTGIYISGASNITGIDGMISLTGISGNGTGSFNEGITILTGSLISAIGNGSITMSGNSSGGVDSNKGIVLFGTDAEVRTNGGGISITGVSSGTGNNNFGISLETGTLINDLGNGLVSLSGTGGDGVDTNFGINLNNTTVSATNNDVIINGTGGNGSGNQNRGISITNGSLIEKTGNNGTIDLTGTGGSGTSGLTGVFSTGSTIQTSEGTISINGSGGVGSGDGNEGVNAGNNAVIEATGLGDISITGTGGSGVQFNRGIVTGSSTISSMGGNLNIIGTGGTGTGNFQVGYTAFNGSNILTNGPGTISISGTGGTGSAGNYGMELLGTAQVVTENGNLQLEGISTDGSTGNRISATVLTTGTGNVIVNGTTSNPDAAAININTDGTLTAGGSITTTASSGKILTPDGVPVANTFTANLNTFNGVLAPGQSFGLLKISGDFNLGTGDALEIAVIGETTPGTDYDQLSVTGTVDITDATLILVDGLAADVSANTEFIIIDNDGADAVIGTFNGLLEGATINFNNQTFTLSYAGGDGNDVSITEFVVPLEITCPADISGDCSINPVTYPFPTATGGTGFPPEILPGFTRLGSKNGKTYFLSDANFDGPGAFANALAQGGNVITIVDEETNTLINDAVEAVAPGLTYYIGYNDLSTEGTFEWQSGIPASYENWLVGEPNGGATENYVWMRPDGFWVDISAGFGARYVLELTGGIEQTAGLPSGINFPVGTTTNTFIATDFSGNTSTCSFDVTLTDITPPEIICPADIVQDNDPGACGAFVNYTIPIPTDDCAPFQPATAQQIDHNYNSSIFCNTGSSHLRIFNLPTEGITTDFLLENINIGIASNNTTESYDVNVYFADQLEYPIGEYVAPLSSQIPPIFSVTNTSPGFNTFVNIPTNIFIPTNKTIIVEIYLPVDANTRAVYNNDNTSETAEGYLNCTDGYFATPSSFGFPNGLLVRLDGQEYLQQITEQTAGLPPNAQFPVGTTTNTYIVTDGAGNTASCSFDVTVNDVEAPTVTCPSDIVVDNDPGLCGAMVDYFVTGFDNCSNASLAGFKMIGFTNEKIYYLSDIRYTTVNAFTDAMAQGGFVASVPSAEINALLIAGANAKNYTGNMILGFNDVATEGTFEWQNGDLVTYTNWGAGQPSNSGTGEDYTIMSATSGTWDDVTEVFSARYILEIENNLFNQTAGLPSGSEFPVGTTTNTFSYTDATGNTNSCSFDITVNDIEVPVAICQDITIQLDATGNATIVATDVDGGSTDNCAVTDYQINIDTFTCADVGNPVTVTLTVLDDAFNSDTCTAIVTVEDVTPPTITCPADQNVDFDSSCQFELPDYTGLATVSDVCDPAPAVTQNPPAGTFISTTTTITLTATDASGNNDSCTFDVIPSDNTAPTITCPVDQIEDLDVNCEFTIPDYTGLATVVDNCDANPVLSQTPIPGTVITGTTIVTIFAEDIDGNMNSCVFNVIPVDNIPPTITCPSDQTEVADAACMLILPDYTSLAIGNDNCGVVLITQIPTPGTLIGIGTTAVTLEASDGSNSSTCVFNVLVEDTTPPLAVCQDITIQLDASGTVVITPNDVNNGSIDNCGIASLTISEDTFTCAAIGTQIVTLTVTDNAGNSSTCDATVTVEDNIPPTANCQDITVSLGEENSVTILPGELDGGHSDNCSIASVTASPTTFTCDDLGPNTVTVIVTDISGNTSTCTSIVTVTEDTPPMAICQPFTAQLDAFGTVTILPTDVDGGSTDNCTIDTLTLSQDTFTCDDVGENTVILTVTDTAGNNATCTTIVTVEDTVAPDAVCQDITVQLDAEGNATITPEDVNGGSNDACGIASLDIDIDTFDCSNVGSNDVTLTVTDVHGNINTCIAIVTVLEENAVPMAVCQNITVPLQADGTAVIEASDINAGSTGEGCIDGVTIDIDTFDCSDIGTPVLVTLFITNGNGDVDTCTAFVNVVDTLDPIITCPDDQVIPGEEAPYTLPDYVALGEVFAEDNCVEISSIVQTPPPGTVLEEGSYNINFVATDATGNDASCLFILTIEEIILQIPEQDSLASLSVFPNPASNYINISNPNQLNLKMVQLFDVTGRLVKTFRVDGTQNQQLDISEIASATYFIIISTKNGEIIKQIIKE